jgi:acetyl esterase
VFRQLPSKKPEADIENRSIPGGPTGEISVRIFRPPGTHNTNLPAIVYLYGGDGSLGDLIPTTDW